jgi:N6-L-threonylcarbamoyladenine synthase
VSVILGIETSCDETAAALVEDGRTVHRSVILSQEELHRRFGGVVPELASRQHVLGIMPAVQGALGEAEDAWDGVDAIAVSRGPGLAGSLLVGVNAAKAMAAARGLPLVGVNHLEGHVYANWLGDGEAPRFPLLCLVVSGGHTELVLMTDHGRYSLLGRTRDDAAGEAFDKVARILGLGYPGGPAIERAAQGIDPADFPARFRLTRPWLRGGFDFSFSGLKTAVLRLAEGGASGPVQNPARLAFVPGAAPGIPGEGGAGLDPAEAALLAAAFQEAVVEVLVGKTCAAAVASGAAEIAIAGGVAANLRLRQAMQATAPVPVRVPSLRFCTDNAAMIAAAGYFRLRAGDVAGWDLDVSPGLRLAPAAASDDPPTIGAA